ncbi:hypothetical protein DEJ30_10370 [Curtobacterium sp. MCPF17_003]|nr:hypothetical protein DEJ30_10370 [Curtobacterium sp. MCPF17_003]
MEHSPGRRPAGAVPAVRLWPGARGRRAVDLRRAAALRHTAPVRRTTRLRVAAVHRRWRPRSGPDVPAVQEDPGPFAHRRRRRDRRRHRRRGHDERPPRRRVGSGPDRRVLRSGHRQR